MKNSIISIILSGLLVGAGTYLIIAKKNNSRLNTSLSLSQLKSDSLIVEKRVLRKQIGQLKKYLDSVERENHHLDTSLTKLKASMAKEDQGIIRLTKSFTEMNKKCDDLLALQKQWYSDRADITAANLKLNKETKDLSAQVSTLSATIQQLSTELALARLFEKDNISIVRLDKNGQPNVKAKKIKKIMVTMSLPSEMKSPTFKIFDSSGNLLPDQDGTFTSNFSNETNAFGTKAARLELIYSLSKKINSGSYHVEIVNEGKHAGNLFMNLR